MIVYISIGNSDDKLTQQEWSDFVVEMDILLSPDALGGSPVLRRHGNWRSLPDEPWQNACWCVEIEDGDADELKDALGVLAVNYRQDSIAWARVLSTELIARPEDAHASPGCGCGTNEAGECYRDPICRIAARHG